MFKSKLISAVIVTGVIAPLISAHAAFAWHPVGVITKQVQNQTTGSILQDADNNAHAVDVKTGDIALYSITVRNDGTADSRGYNDMANVVVTDTLPVGVELASNPTTRTITENLGTIVPGAHVTKTYTVKVTDTTNLEFIENKACFTGNSTVNDNAQSGCNSAIIRTNIPQVLPPVTTTVPTPPATTPVPVPVATPAPVVKATVLPNTGPKDVVELVATATVLAYATSLVVLTKRNGAGSR
jgi:uncharacterized repeat protein (TIGR01451 family)